MTEINQSIKLDCIYKEDLENNSLQKEPYFQIPKILFADKKYAKFSCESKILFSMILNNANGYKEIIETAELIKNFDTNTLSNMLKISKMEEN